MTDVSDAEIAAANEVFRERTTIYIPNDILRAALTAAAQVRERARVAGLSNSERLREDIRQATGVGYLPPHDPSKAGLMPIYGATEDMPPKGEG